MVMMFRVGKGGGFVNGAWGAPGTPQYSPLPPPTGYVQVTWPYQVVDTTGWFDFVNGVWRPLADGIAIMDWQVWNSANANVSLGNSLVSKLIGVDAAGVNKGQDAGAIGDPGAFANTSAQKAGVTVLVASGDVWRIDNYCIPISGQQGKIDADDAHTYWSCAFFPF